MSLTTKLLQGAFLSMKTGFCSINSSGLHFPWLPLPQPDIHIACWLGCSPFGDLFVYLLLGLCYFLKLIFLLHINTELFEAGALSSLILQHAEKDHLETSLKETHAFLSLGQVDGSAEEMSLPQQSCALASVLRASGIDTISGDAFQVFFQELIKDNFPS